MLLTTLALALGINFALFLIAFARQSDKLTDFAYSISFVSIIIMTLIFADNIYPTLTIAACFVGLWAIRLGVFLVARIRKKGKDSRFDDMRSNFIRFLKFWLLQAVVAWVLLLPFLFAASRTTSLQLMTFVGLAIALIGLAVESVADIQKFQFNEDNKNKGKWIQSGLWSLSRHPNYFGEVTVWIGLYVALLPALSPTQRIIGLLSPLTIYLILRYVSGIPILEKSADHRADSINDVLDIPHAKAVESDAVLDDISRSQTVGLLTGSVHVIGVRT